MTAEKIESGDCSIYRTAGKHAGQHRGRQRVRSDLSPICRRLKRGHKRRRELQREVMKLHDAPLAAWQLKASFAGDAPDRHFAFAILPRNTRFVPPHVRAMFALPQKAAVQIADGAHPQDGGHRLDTAA